MGKNSQLHLVLETNFLNLLKEKANVRKISLAEYCREKLREGDQFEEIKFLLKSIIKKNEK